MARRDDPLKLLNTVFSKVREWNITRCGIETVLFQKVLCDLLVERCDVWNSEQRRQKKTNYIWPGTFEEVKPPKGVGPKDARVRALIGTCFEEGRVYIRRTHTDFVDEYLHFPLGRTRDILDAFAYTSLLWFPGQTQESVLAYEQEEQKWLNQRDSVTGY